VCHYACGYTQKRVGSIICEYACQDHAFMLLVTLEYAISRIATACKIEVGSVGDNILQTLAGILRASCSLFSFILE
jgi:hypothetical protein